MHMQSKIRKFCGCGCCHPTAIHFAMLTAISLVFIGGVLLCKAKKKAHKYATSCHSGESDSITRVVVKEIYPSEPDSDE